MFMFLFFEHNKKTNKIYITGPYIKQTSKLGFQNKKIIVRYYMEPKADSIFAKMVISQMWCRLHQQRQHDSINNNKIYELL